MRHPWKRVKWRSLAGLVARGAMSMVAGRHGETWMRSRTGHLFEVRMARGATEWRWERPRGGD